MRHAAARGINDGNGWPSLMATIAIMDGKDLLVGLSSAFGGGGGGDGGRPKADQKPTNPSLMGQWLPSLMAIAAIMDGHGCHP